MNSSLFITNYMNHIFNNDNKNTLDKLKKENERLMVENKELNGRLQWVIIAKDEIYNNYINLILSSEKK